MTKMLAKDLKAEHLGRRVRVPMPKGAQAEGMLVEYGLRVAMVSDTRLCDKETRYVPGATSGSLWLLGLEQAIDVGPQDTFTLMN